MSHIPPSHRAVSPYFLVSRAADMIDFLKGAFDATEITKLEREDGSIMHAALAIDDSVVMVGSREQAVQNSTHLYVANVDATFFRCLQLGAQCISEPKDFPYGDRSAGIRDPFGNIWWLGTPRRVTGAV